MESFEMISKLDLITLLKCYFVVCFKKIIKEQANDYRLTCSFCFGGYMAKRKSDYMIEFITNQFPLKAFKEMIFAYINLVESFQMMLNDENYYIKITPRYEMKISSNRQISNSKIETFVISKYDSKEKMEECILKYPIAFNILNEMERKVFTATYLENKKDLEIIEDFCLHSKLLNVIRKSAIVKFSLTLGFDKFTDYF